MTPPPETPDEATDVSDLTDEADDVENTGAPPPRSRRAWRPEAGDEIAAVLRVLCARPWLVAGRDDAHIAAVRRNQAAIRDVFDRLGWVLVVERDLVRLRKSPPVRRAEWAARGPSPLAASWFFLLVAAAESMPRWVGLGQLVTAARAAAAEVGLPSTGTIGERRAIVAALKMLDERGVVERVEGDLEGFVQDEDAPVLLAVHHTRLVHVIANVAGADPQEDPEAWLGTVEHEPDAARRMRRRLVDDTVVHVCDLDPAESDWLSRRVRGDDGGPLAQAFGLHLERRLEGAAFVVPDGAFRHARDLGPLAFPMPGTVGHAALLLCDHAAAHGTVLGAPGMGWRGVGHEEVVERLVSLAALQATGRGGWGQEYADDIEHLADEILALLGGLGLVRTGGAAAKADISTSTGDRMWWFSPTTGRWPAPGAAVQPERPVPTPTPR